MAFFKVVSHPGRVDASEKQHLNTDQPLGLGLAFSVNSGLPAKGETQNREVDGSCTQRPLDIQYSTEHPGRGNGSLSRKAFVTFAFDFFSSVGICDVVLLRMAVTRNQVSYSPDSHTFRATLSEPERCRSLPRIHCQLSWC